MHDPTYEADYHDQQALDHELSRVWQHCATLALPAKCPQFQIDDVVRKVGNIHTVISSEVEYHWYSGWRVMYRLSDSRWRWSEGTMQLQTDWDDEQARYNQQAQIERDRIQEARKNPPPLPKLRDYVTERKATWLYYQQLEEYSRAVISHVYTYYGNPMSAPGNVYKAYHREMYGRSH